MLLWANKPICEVASNCQIKWPDKAASFQILDDCGMTDQCNTISIYRRFDSHVFDCKTRASTKRDVFQTRRKCPHLPIR